VRSKVLIIVLVIALNSIAQQYNLQTYTVKEGLAHSQVSQIIQDKDGSMWFTLFGGGVSRFDGKHFYNLTEKEGLCSNLLRPILKDHTGMFWFGALGGPLCTYNGKQFKKFSAKGANLNDHIYALCEDEKNNIWIGADSGVYIYDGKIIKHLSDKDGVERVPVMDIFRDSKNRMWIAPWEKGIYLIENGKVTNYKRQDGLSYHTAMSFSEDNSGNIWLSTFKGVTKISTINNKLVFSILHHPILDSMVVFRVVDDKKSKLYFATGGKGMVVYDYKTKKFENISVKNGLPGNIVYNIKRDTEGNLWISCWGYGITKFSGGRFVHYTKTDGLLQNSSHCFFQNEDGSILIGTGNGINQIKDNIITHFIKEINNETVFSIVTDRDGGIWFTSNLALYHYQNNKLKKYTDKDGLKSFPVSSLAMGYDGKLWMASWTGGVTSLKDGVFTNYNVSNGLSSGYIYSIYPDKKGNVWISTWDGGICNINRKEISYYKKENGLPGNNVIGATNDKEGNLWIATYGGGVARFDGKKFSVISTASGLSDDACNGLLIDRKNNLWVATGKGLEKIDLTQYNKNRIVKIRHYGAEEGFPALECLRNALFEDKDGFIWFGTKNGATKYDPSEDNINTIEPNTQITDVKLFFEKFDYLKFAKSIDVKTGLPENFKLTYDNNHLTFDFIGVSHTSPEKVRYQYQLVGVDKDWSPISDKTEATYSGLQPGHYTFKVKACNNDGVWNKQETIFKFEIRSPWYKTGWAYLSYIIIGISIYIVTVKVRTKKLTEDKLRLEKTVKERTFEIEQQKNLVEQKNKEITDSIQYAKRIQNALLPNDKYVEKNLDRLKNKDKKSKS
jgi:ligand-binding sensor domain-containing protein